MNRCYRALALVLAFSLGGCFAGSRAHLQETSPSFSELGPRRVGVVVAGEASRDAQTQIDRFSVRYPKAIGPDTLLPTSPGAVRDMSLRLSRGLVRHLEDKGYEVEEIDGSGKRVRDLLRSSDVDALMVVHFRPVHRWPVSEYQGTEIRQIGAIQEEVSQYLYDIEQGLLILPTAHLLDTRTSLRLWSHANLGLQSDRVAMDDPVRRLGVVAEGDPLPVEELVPPAVDAVLAFYFDSIPRAPARRSPAPTAEREAELVDRAVTDRWRIHERLLYDFSAGYARRAQSVEGPSSIEIEGDPAFGGYWNLELGARMLSRRWIQGPRLTFQRSSADYRRLVADTSESPPFATAFEEVTLKSSTSIDVVYTIARAWQPRRPALLTAGLGPAVAIGIVDGSPLKDQTLVQLGVVGEAEALWAGETFLAGPFVRTGWMAGLQGGNATSFVVGARVAASY